jgi:hypothetical protein
MKKGEIVATHTKPDLDAIVSLYLIKNYDPEKKITGMFFLGEGGYGLQQLRGVTLVDIGGGELDHHGEEQTETASSKVAKKLQEAGKLEIDKPIQQLLKLVQRNDFMGITEPFVISDIVKCMQRTEVQDEKIVEVGTRLVQDVMDFRKKGLQRDNQYAREIISEFMKDKAILLPKFKRYLELLENPNFTRPFDFVEIASVEKDKTKDEKEFLFQLLEFVYQDSESFLEALEIVNSKSCWKKELKGLKICAAITDNTKFSQAARSEEGAQAAIVIQRQDDGHNQIYFDTQKVDGKLIDDLVCAIRLEECLIQKRDIPPEHELKKPEWAENIPEWYYYVAPTLGKKKPGRFIMNGSLTAPNVPPSKIPWGRLLYIVEQVIRYQPFNFEHWRHDRILANFLK